MCLIRYMLFVMLAASVHALGIFGAAKPITSAHTQGHDLTQVWGNAKLVWSSAAPVEYTLPSNCVSYWKMTETTGGLSFDTFGINTGSLQNVTLSGSDGYSFNGTTSYVDFLNKRLTSSSVGTISTWVRFNSFANAAKVFNYGGSVSIDAAVFSLEIREVEGVFYAAGIARSESGTRALSTVIHPTALSLDTWYHFAITGDGTKKTVFLNGVGSSTAGFSGINDALWLGNVSAGAPNHSSFGSGFYAGAFVFFLNGNIMDAGIWDRCLTDTELLYLYNSGRNVFP